jgi:3-deoxy-D-manno-octulosonate 8-phosphate phosphatase (KDO 8-P phosphatase)
MTLSAQDRARRIKIILFDVDGVLTNGNIWIIPVPVAGPDGAITSKMVEAKALLPSGSARLWHCAPAI